MSTCLPLNHGGGHLAAADEQLYHVTARWEVNQLKELGDAVYMQHQGKRDQDGNMYNKGAQKNK